jgi:hypothetical protein
VDGALADRHHPGLRDPSIAPHQLDIPVGQILRLRRVVASVGHLVAVPEHPLGVDRPVHRLGCTRGEAGGRHHLGRAQQRLGGHAREEGALSAHTLTLDEHDRRVRLVGAQSTRGRFAGRATTQDDNRVSHGC